MKKIHVAMLLFSSFALVACGNKADETSSNSKVEYSSVESTSVETSSVETSSVESSAVPSSSAESSVSEASSSSTSESTSALWNASKEASLKEYMAIFSEKMNQPYKQYGPGNNVNMYGLEIPDGLLVERTMIPAINMEPIDKAWSEDGTGTAEYNVVDVYSDAERDGVLTRHVYLFAIQNGNPIVLVSMQNQGNDLNAFNVYPTENPDIATAFDNIIRHGSYENK